MSPSLRPPSQKLWIYLQVLLSALTQPVSNLVHASQLLLIWLFRSHCYIPNSVLSGPPSSPRLAASHTFFTHSPSDPRSVPLSFPNKHNRLTPRSHTQLLTCVCFPLYLSTWHLAYSRLCSGPYLQSILSSFLITHSLVHSFSLNFLDTISAPSIVLARGYDDEQKLVILVLTDIIKGPLLFTHPSTASSNITLWNLQHLKSKNLSLSWTAHTQLSFCYMLPFPTFQQHLLRMCLSSKQ